MLYYSHSYQLIYRCLCISLEKHSLQLRKCEGVGRDSMHIRYRSVLLYF